jgi:hypothetical protein
MDITFLYIYYPCPFFKKMSYAYVQWAFDQIVNAHAQIYDQWASPFSISIMHACPKKIKILCYVWWALVYHKYSYV